MVVVKTVVVTRAAEEVAKMMTPRVGVAVVVTAVVVARAAV